MGWMGVNKLKLHPVKIEDVLVRCNLILRSGYMLMEKQNACGRAWLGSHQNSREGESCYCLIPISNLVNSFKQLGSTLK